MHYKIAVGAMVFACVLVFCAIVYSLSVKQESKTFKDNNTVSKVVIGADGCTYVYFYTSNHPLIVHSDTCTNCEKQAEKE